MRHGELDALSTAPDRRSTVFLDRDGVINRRREGSYVTTWAEFEFLPRATEALRRLVESGYRIIVVTNQRGIARGRMTEADLRQVHGRLLEEARLAGGAIAAIYYCPHEIGECRCRKPETGLFLEARREFADIDFSASVVIGDSPSDMEAGQRLGCRTILVGQSDRYASAPTLYDAVVMYLASPTGRPTSAGR
jgi:D-glycero-D-manno-heptose 1,7-bisphosphate phosphatase